MKPIVRTDAAGVPRHVSFSRAETQEAFGPLAPQAQADEFLRKHGYLLALTEPSLDSLAKTVARRPDSSQSELRVETQKRVQDTHVVGYAQTYFGLPVVAAGVSVTLRDDPPSVLAASSTVVHSIDVARPSDTDLKRLDAKFEQREGQSVRVADLGLALATNGDDSKYDARINAARLVVFQFRTKEREAQPHEHPGTEQEGLQQEGLPTLPLPPLPATIRDGAFYVAEEVYFTMTTPQSGRLNWVMYVDASTLAILKLRALVDHATASVFLRDPITKGSGVLASA
ncbi:MAG TPA: hypothetical protein VJV78_07330, partial [Polyangiales bacterium]|nr:hypothetical protein [Polyangiales bacterium]